MRLRIHEMEGRKKAAYPINREVAARRPIAMSMVLHLFLGKEERKLDYARAKLTRRRKKGRERPIWLSVLPRRKPLSPCQPSATLDRLWNRISSCFVTIPPPPSSPSDGLIFLIRKTADTVRGCRFAGSIPKRRHFPLALLFLGG